MQAFEEPLRKTLFRTVTIAVVVGGAIAFSSRKWSYWALATLLALWPSFGGHWVEVWFLNWLRPRISPNAGVQSVSRILVWFGGGCLLAEAMRLTASAFGQGRTPQWFSWWVGGVAFVGIELAVHLVIQFRGRPSFYSGLAGR